MTDEDTKYKRVLDYGMREIQIITLKIECTREEIRELINALESDCYSSEFVSNLVKELRTNFLEKERKFRR